MNTKKQKVSHYLDQLADALEQTYSGNLDYRLPISRETQFILKQTANQDSITPEVGNERSATLENWKNRGFTRKPSSSQTLPKQAIEEQSEVTKQTLSKQAIEEQSEVTKQTSPKPETKTDSLVMSANVQTCEEIASNAPNLSTLHARLRDCRRCSLANERQTIVFGMGNEKADLLLIGEGPGAEEDQQGKPFVGKAGKLLTQLIRSIGLPRQAIYLGNVVKCRPPGNREPHIEEIESCLPILKKQIELIQPKLIVTLGNIATKNLIGTVPGITKTAGKEYEFNGITVIPLYHPAFLLRQQSYLEQTWDHMQTIRKHLI